MTILVGRYGYFEGSFKLNDKKALINWYETSTASDGKLKPTVGSGWIVYNETFDFLEGGIGGSALTGSYGTFVTLAAKSGTLKIDSTNTAAAEDFSKNCLLARSSTSVPWESRMGTFLPSTSANYFSAGGKLDEREKMQALASTYWKSEQVCFAVLHDQELDADTMHRVKTTSASIIST